MASLTAATLAPTLWHEVSMVCSRCGQASRENAHFCDACGTALSDSGATAVVSEADGTPIQRLNDIFVGRRDELAQLTVALDGCLQGNGRLITLMGEPGIGKTRTARELAATAAARGFTVLWGRCHEEGGAPSFWMWIESIRAY